MSVAERAFYAPQAQPIQRESGYGEIFWIGIACVGVCLVSLILAVKVPAVAEGLALLG